MAVANGGVGGADTGNNRVVELSAKHRRADQELRRGARPERKGDNTAGNVWVSDTAWNRIVELSAWERVLLHSAAPAPRPQPVQPCVAPGDLKRALFKKTRFNDRIKVYDLP